MLKPIKKQNTFCLCSEIGKCGKKNENGFLKGLWISKNSFQSVSLDTSVKSTFYMMTDVEFL